MYNAIGISPQEPSLIPALQGSHLPPDLLRLPTPVHALQCSHRLSLSSAIASAGSHAHIHLPARLCARPPTLVPAPFVPALHAPLLQPQPCLTTRLRTYKVNVCTGSHAHTLRVAHSLAVRASGVVPRLNSVGRACCPRWRMTHVRRFLLDSDTGHITYAPECIPRNEVPQERRMRGVGVEVKDGAVAWRELHEGQGYEMSVTEWRDSQVKGGYKDR